MARRNPWPKGVSRKRVAAGKKAALTRKKNAKARSAKARKAAKKAWRTRRKGKGKGCR